MTNSTSPAVAADTSGRLTLQWRSVAAASLFVTLAASTGLAIIASTKKADTLSTIALVLAIIAFIAQLMIFVAQTGAAATQERRSADISATTLGLLAEIRATAAGSDQLLRDQFGVVIRQLVRTAVPRGVREAAASKKEFDPGQFERNIVRSIEGSVRAQLGGAYPVTDSRGKDGDEEWEPPKLSARARGVLNDLDTWPDVERAARIHSELFRLTPMCFLQFLKLCEDYVFSLRVQVEPGLFGGESSLISERLVEFGLVERFDYVPEDGDPGTKYRYTLSVHGLELAPLLTAPLSEMPDYVKALDLESKTRD